MTITDQPRHPNFFIVGAPKCGTTALCEYINTHPNIYISAIKEPNYFSTDLPIMREKCIKSIDDYMNLFKFCTPEHQAIGEASVWYLYSNTAIKNINLFNPDAKIIVMLRNPVDLAYSLHSQHLYANIETEIDFHTAWSKQEKRLSNSILQYGSIAKMGEQVERLLDIFNRDQVLFILFDEFVNDTAAVYKKVLQFLNIEVNTKTNFPVINKNRRNRFNMIRNFIYKTPPILVYILKYYKYIFNIERVGLLDNLNTINTKHVERLPLSKKHRDEMVSFFRTDIYKLEKILNKSLDNWYK